MNNTGREDVRNRCPKLLLAIVIVFLIVGCGGHNEPKTGYDLRRVYQGEGAPEPLSHARKISQVKKSEAPSDFSEVHAFELTVRRDARRRLVQGLEKAAVAEAERRQMSFTVRSASADDGAESFVVSCKDQDWSCAVSGFIEEKQKLPRGLVCLSIRLSYRESKL